jgi:hypothetical protein
VCWRDIPARNLTANALFDPCHKPGRMAFHQLLEAGAKFVQQVHSGIVPYRRTKIAERSRGRAIPGWTVSHMNSGRSQHSKEVSGVHFPPSSVIARHKNTRSGIYRAPYKAVAARWMVAEVPLQQGRIQILVKKIARRFLSRLRIVDEPEARLRRPCDIPQRRFAGHIPISRHRPSRTR